MEEITYRVVNLTRDRELASKVRLATSFSARLIGLLKHEELPPGEGLLIRPCKSVHTFGMRFPIDVLFLDERGVIVDAWCQMPPNRLTWPVREAKEVLELPAGTVLAARTIPGDRLALVKNENIDKVVSIRKDKEEAAPKQHIG